MHKIAIEIDDQVLRDLLAEHALHNADAAEHDGEVLTFEAWLSGQIADVAANTLVALRRTWDDLQVAGLDVDAGVRARRTGVYEALDTFGGAPLVGQNRLALAKALGEAIAAAKAQLGD